MVASFRHNSQLMLLVSLDNKTYEKCAFRVYLLMMVLLHLCHLFQLPLNPFYCQHHPILLCLMNLLMTLPSVLTPRLLVFPMFSLTSSSLNRHVSQFKATLVVTLNLLVTT
jgi:hypothetical protein